MFSIQSASIYCIGIGEDGLLGEKKDLVESATVVVSPKKFFPLIPKGINCSDILPLERSIRLLKDFDGPGHAVLLASGDPLFFGIGRRLLKEIDPDRLVFYPAPTWIQSACARLKLVWEDIKWVSLHGRDGDILGALCPFLTPGSRIAILTDPKNTPSTIAKEILDHPASRFLNIKFHIAQNLSQDDERVETLEISEVKNRKFSSLNVTIIEIDSVERIHGFGLEEELYVHDKGLITKAEVRAVVLSKLRLFSGNILWDIGAGSGSVSIEAWKLYPFIRCYAIEKDNKRFNQLKENISNHFAFGLTPVLGSAPEILSGLCDPDRVFIGGGITTNGLLDEVSSRLKRGGVLVVTCVLLESLKFLLDKLPKLGFKFNLVELQVSRSEILGKGFCLRAQNPIFIFQAIKDRG